MAHCSINPYARAARLEKATKLADVLASSEIVSRLDDLARCAADSEIWLAAAAKVCVKPPGAETCKLVIEMLRMRARKVDPFEKFEEAS